jgi:hypothetical protein
VTLATTGLPDEVVAVAASYDQALHYGAQTPFSDQLAAHWVGSQWQYDPQHDSVITTGNGGTKPTQAAFTLFYNQGTQKYQMEQTLQPGEQMWVDIGKLIRESIPDKNGKTLPADLTTGSYEIRDLNNHAIGTLFEGKVIYDKTYGHVTYGCGLCCGDKKIQLWYDPLSIPFADPSDDGVNGWNACGGFWEDISDGFYGNWNVVNTSIATVDYYGTHTGQSVGSTTSSTYGQFTGWRPGTVNCPVQGGSPGAPVNSVSIYITNHDLEQNNFSSTVDSAAGVSGALWMGTAGTTYGYSVSYNNDANVGPGSYAVPFNRPGLQPDTYTTVRSTWYVGTEGAEPTESINLVRDYTVFGTVRHSTYNTPYESSCTANTQTAWIFNTSCNFTQVSLKSDFVTQTYINGSGVSLNYGSLQYNSGSLCSGSYPTGANTTNSFLQVTNIDGSCGTTVVGGDSVATYPNPAIVGGTYVCGDNILLVTSANTNQAIKHVADYCPACSAGFNGTNGHIDNYNSSQACSAHNLGDYGNFWTADTH